MDLIQRLFNKVILDGQAYLHAQIMRLITEKAGEPVSNEQFEKWMDEFKLETKQLIDRIIEGNENES